MNLKICPVQNIYLWKLAKVEKVQSNSTNNLTSDLGINGELGFSKATGKTMISLQADISNYNVSTDIRNNVRISVYIPNNLSLSSAMPEHNCFKENETLIKCSFTILEAKNKILFNIDKMPDNYDPNKPETHPKVKAEIYSSETGISFKDTNPTNNIKIITVGPL